MTPGPNNKEARCSNARPGTLADAIVGLVISAMIIVLLAGTVRSIGRRLMDGDDDGRAR